MNASDKYGLGYRDVDGDPHTPILVSSMDATAGWQATLDLRAWERSNLALVDGERLLDVGCGTGDAAIALAHDLGSAGELVGLDASSTMIEVARKRSVGAPCDVRFAVGDARRLDEADGSFDAVRSERTLQWLLEPGVAVAEFGRVLRPGGRLSLIDTDWSTLRLDVGNQRISTLVREGVRLERKRASNVGRRLPELAVAAGFSVLGTTRATQTWTEWRPDESPAPDGFHSMTSLAEGLVDTGHLDSDAAHWFVDTIESEARNGKFTLSLTMHAMIAVLE